MLGIIGAMEIEVSGIKNMLENISVETFSKINYYKGNIGNLEVVVAKCNEGKVNAAVCAQTMILKYKPDEIINIGVGGSLRADIKIGDLVIATDTVHHDFDMSFIGYEKGYVGGIDTVKISCDVNLIQKLKNAAKNAEIPVVEGVIASGDQFIGGNYKKEEIARNFDAIVCEMEGASIGHVCKLNDIPYAVIRSISDNADDDSDISFETFAQESAKVCTELIFNYIKL